MIYERLLLRSNQHQQWRLLWWQVVWTLMPVYHNSKIQWWWATKTQWQWVGSLRWWTLSSLLWPSSKWWWTVRTNQTFTTLNNLNRWRLPCRCHHILQTKTRIRWASRVSQMEAIITILRSSRRMHSLGIKHLNLNNIWHQQLLTHQHKHLLLARASLRNRPRFRSQTWVLPSDQNWAKKKL